MCWLKYQNMALTEENKEKIMLNHFMTKMTAVLIDRDDWINFPDKEGLNIVDDFMKALTDEDYLKIQKNNIF